MQQQQQPQDNDLDDNDHGPGGGGISGGSSQKAEAIRSLEACVSLAPAMWAGHMQLGGLHAHSGNMPAAADAYESASLADPLDPESHFMAAGARYLHSSTVFLLILLLLLLQHLVNPRQRARLRRQRELILPVYPVVASHLSVRFNRDGG